MASSSSSASPLDLSTTALAEQVQTVKAVGSRGGRGDARPHRVAAIRRTGRSSPSTPTGSAPAPAPSTTSADAASRSGRWPACPSRSRTPCALAASAPPAARRSSKGTFLRTTPPWSRASALPTRSSPARRTWTSSPWARRPRTAPTAWCTTRGTSPALPAARPAAAPSPWPRVCRRHRSAATPAARSGNRPPSLAPSG